MTTLGTTVKDTIVSTVKGTGTSQVGGDLGHAAKGTVLGVLHGTTEVGGEAAAAVGWTLRSIVTTTTEVGGDVGTTAGRGWRASSKVLEALARRARAR